MRRGPKTPQVLLPALAWLLLLGGTPAAIRSQATLQSEAEVRDDRLAKARSALSEGDAADAEALFRRVLLEQPDLPAALLGWAESLRAQGREREASARVLAAAQRWLARDRLTDAEEGLRWLASLDPPRVESLALLGEVLTRGRRFREAEPVLRAAVERQAGPAATLLLGSVLWENGLADEAATVLRAAAEDPGPIAGAAWTQLGRLELWRSRPEDALLALTEAEKRGAGGLELELERSRALAQALESAAADELLAEALESHARLVKRLPESSQIRYRYARLLARAGSAEQAREQMKAYQGLVAADRARAQRSGVLAGRVASARERLSSGDAQGALDALEGLHRSTEVAEARAIALLELDRAGEAVRELEAALEQDPTRTELRPLLARARLRD